MSLEFNINADGFYPYLRNAPTPQSTKSRKEVANEIQAIIRQVNALSLGSCMIICCTVSFPPLFDIDYSECHFSPNV